MCVRGWRGESAGRREFGGRIGSSIWKVSLGRALDAGIGISHMGDRPGSRERWRVFRAEGGRGCLRNHPPSRGQEVPGNTESKAEHTTLPSPPQGPRWRVSRGVPSARVHGILADVQERAESETLACVQGLPWGRWLRPLGNPLARAENVKAEDKSCPRRL